METLSTKLESLTAGKYCSHKSWGFGKVREVESDTNQIIIDFQTKKGHAMQLEYAVESLVSHPDSHILALRMDKLEELKAQSESDPVAVIKNCIVSLGSQATADGIQSVLSPSVVSAAAWKKWWESAKRAMKKDGLIVVSTKKAEPLKLLSAPVDEPAKVMEAFRDAVGSKAVLLSSVAITKCWDAVKADADEVLAKIQETMSKTPVSQLATLLEMAIVREQILTLAGKPIDQGPHSLASLIPRDARGLGNVLDQLALSKQEPIILTLQRLMPEGWARLLSQVLPKANARTAEAIASTFVEAGRAEEVHQSIDRLIRERNVTSDFLYWFGKNRPKDLEDLINPTLFMAILSVLERDMMGETKKGTKLYELLLNDKTFVGGMLRNSPLEDVRDVTRATLLSPVFKELDKRSFLGTLVKLFPEVQSMIVGEKSTEETSLIVSWESLERRKLELEEINNKKIPENSKEIGVARSYGDLRENHEFKAAKEMQTVLMRRKAELESMLIRARGTDFKGVETNVVNIGTKVVLKDVNTGELLKYTILGAWDSDPVQGIVSYLTPLAKSILNKKVGVQVEILTDEGLKRSVTIEKIESYK
jgi:transcription elongation GreA/GreB family factor/transcription elongation factor GreA-like protein